MAKFRHCEAGIILPNCELDCRIIGLKCLQHDAARIVAATRAAGDLRDELKRPLGGAKVRQRQRRVAGDHAHQRDVRIIQTLGDHLRTEHHL